MRYDLTLICANVREQKRLIHCVGGGARWPEMLRMATVSIETLTESQKCINKLPTSINSNKLNRQSWRKYTAVSDDCINMTRHATNQGLLKGPEIH